MYCGNNVYLLAVWLDNVVCLFKCSVSSTLSMKVLSVNMEKQSPPNQKLLVVVCMLMNSHHNKIAKPNTFRK